MGSFFEAVTSYPTAVYTALLGAVLFYWVLALVGLVDFESSGFELDLQADSAIDDIGGLAGFIIAFGLAGVPFSIVVSLIVLSSWTLSCLAGMWVLPLVPTTLLNFVAGTAVLLVSFALSLPLTAWLLRPTRKLFVTHNAVSNGGLVGQPCVVTTSSVDEQFGYAEVKRRGAGLNVRVWAHVPNTLTKGSNARIAEYDAAGERFLIEPEL
ncbi:MAG: ubiquinone biosynthesis protein [Rhizobacter sp.]